MIVNLKRKKRADKSKIERSICEDGLLRPWPDAGLFIGSNRSEVYALLASGVIPYVRITDKGSRKIPKRSLVEYLNSRVVERPS